MCCVKTSEIQNTNHSIMESKLQMSTDTDGERDAVVQHLSLPDLNTENDSLITFATASLFDDGTIRATFTGATGIQSNDVVSLCLVYTGYSPFALFLGNLAIKERKWSEARAQYEKAAKAGSDVAMYRLAKMLLLGQGRLPVEWKRAAELFQHDKLRGYDEARFWRGWVLAEQGGWAGSPQTLHKAMGLWRGCITLCAKFLVIFSEMLLQPRMRLTAHLSSELVNSEDFKRLVQQAKTDCLCARVLYDLCMDDNDGQYNELAVDRLKAASILVDDECHILVRQRLVRYLPGFNPSLADDPVQSRYPPFLMNHAHEKKARNEEKNRDEALKILLEVADMGFANAMFRAARIYRARGLADANPAAEFASAYKYNMMAASTGHIDANVALAKVRESGQCPDGRDTQAALHYWTYTAHWGRPLSMALLGIVYSTGLFGVVKNEETALQWMNKALACGVQPEQLSEFLPQGKSTAA